MTGKELAKIVTADLRYYQERRANQEATKDDNADARQRYDRLVGACRSLDDVLARYTNKT